MAIFTVVLDNTSLGGINNDGYNAFVDAQGNSSNDIINVYVTPSYNGDLSNYVDIWADLGDTINVFLDPAYRPVADASATNVTHTQGYSFATGDGQVTITFQ